MFDLDLDKFQELLGYRFNNKELLKQAFIHKSFLNESHKKSLKSNERLEFLGDAVLEILCSDYLFDKFPDRDEGRLSKMRSKAVCEESFAKIGRDLGLSPYLVLGHGADLQDARNRDSLLADCFEALSGAIYRDGGMDFLRQFFYACLDKMDLSNPSAKRTEDPKSSLQTLLSRKGLDFQYRILSKKGPDHDPTFEIALYVDGIKAVIGKGSSVKRAEASAAENYLQNQAD